MANIHVGTNEMKQSNAEGERDFRDTSQVRVSGNKRRKHKFPQNAQSQPTQGLSPGCAQGPPLWTLTPNKVSLHLSLSLSHTHTHNLSGISIAASLCTLTTLLSVRRNMTSLSIGTGADRRTRTTSSRATHPRSDGSVRRKLQRQDEGPRENT